MMKPPVLWRSGQDTNWSACPSGSLAICTSRDGAGSSPGPREMRVSREAAPPRCNHVLTAAYVRARLCELERRPPPSVYQPFLFSNTPRRLPTHCNPAFLKMGNRKSSLLDGKISYRSNGVSYEKEDGAAYSIQSKKLEPLRMQGGGVIQSKKLEPLEKSTQTAGQVVQPLGAIKSNVGKPAPLRGGSSGPESSNVKPRPNSPAHSMTSDGNSSSATHNVTSQSSLSPTYQMWREKELSPGPGFHNLPGTLGGPAYTMSPRFKPPTRAYSPGPGHYAPKLSPSGPAFSIRGRIGTRTGRSISSSASRSQSPTPNPHADRPGHGVYVKLKSKELAVNTRIKKKAEKREPIWARKKPGEKKEISYFIVRVNPEGPAYKITRAGAVLLADQTGARGRSPGLSETSLPARRESARSNSRSSSASRTSSPSWSPTRSWSPTPGPGEHQRVEYKSSGPSVTIKSRIKLPSKENYPGPGTYYVKPRPGSPSFSLGYRRQVRNDAAAKPGPGTYKIPWKPDGPSFSIFGRPKDSPPRSRSPGPAYKYDNNTIGYGMPAFTITGKPKNFLPNRFPGPGTYPSVSSPRGPSFSILPKISPRTREDSPGPGEYNPKPTTSSPSFTIKGKAHDPLGPDIPGPGSYTARSTMDGPSFSIHGKLSPPASPRSDSPGPGTYAVPSRPSSPSFSIYGQVKRPEPDNFPGPGSYCPRLSKDGPKISIKGKVHDVPKSRSPGPAAYNPDASSKHSSRSNSPAFSIRKKIIRVERPNSPGPGAYFLPSQNEGPFFSMGRRIRKPSRSVSPGPGTYEATDLDDTRFPTPPKFGFGIGARM